MFESLTEKLQSAFKRLSGQGKLTEKNVADVLREVRLALLEADVNFKVVRTFINEVRSRSLGQEVLGSLTPELQIAKIIGDELTKLMGEASVKIELASSGPTVVLMVGLQGSGKTTASAKLADKYKKEGRNPLLAAADIYRPAAIKQLQVLGQQVEVPVFTLGTDVSPLKIAESAVQEAVSEGYNFVIIDTAGRLHLDEELMDELKSIKSSVNPDEILLVVDSMTGQDAVNVAERFNQDLDISGVVLTKLDGDARGGAALSIRSVTDKPIKLISTGEKVDASTLEEFYPDQYAEFWSMAGKQEVHVPEEVCRNLSEEQHEQLYMATIIHEKPLNNALGEEFRNFLTRDRVREIFLRM